jgi:hypothetical protein
MKKKLNKIYLAIPYSKMDVELSYKLANEMFAYFLNRGNNVFSPITHSHPLTKLGFRGDWDFWQDCDHQFIDWSDEIVVVVPPTDNGWELVFTSTGVQAEIKYGDETGKKTKYIDFVTKKFVTPPVLISEE